ncbi:MAG: lysophospholipid acyltransferase family protein [Candidatus Competibacteraceae bacterium]|nr:lysophospholipid acyltransferase family protein [Candidatus Competibacteraceae bacterium]
MNRSLRFLFFAVLIRPIIFLILGINIRRPEYLPKTGPAILVANHNSHLDTPVLMSLLPLRLLHRARPVASADYFLRQRWLAWFATRIIGIIPLPLGSRRPKEELFAEMIKALNQGAILILFPEGTRGEPEQFGKFKKGIAVLAERLPQTPIHPIYLHGLGKALPKGEMLLVPFFCDAFVGEALYWNGNRREFMELLDGTMRQLAQEGSFAAWE